MRRSFPFIKLPRTLADYIYGHMPSTDAEPSPSQNDPARKGLPALLTNLTWQKDKKNILLVAGGAVLALVIIVVLIPHGSADANTNIESQMKNNPIQALASLAARVRPDLEVASVDGAAQTVTLKDKNGALSTFRFDPQTKTLVPMPTVQPQAASTPQPPPVAEQPATTLPVWMPVYPATTPEIVSSAVSPEGDKETIMTFKSEDKPSAIVHYYQAQLQENGFKIEAASSGEPGGSIQAHDAEQKRMLVLSVNAGETGTVSRVVTVQKK
jgi:hypothetical protein